MGLQGPEAQRRRVDAAGARGNVSGMIDRSNAPERATGGSGGDSAAAVAGQKERDKVSERPRDADDPATRGFEYDYKESIVFWVLPTARAMKRALNEEFAKFGVTHQQWRVLLRLARDSDVCQADLAKQMTIEPPTLAGILDRMERSGWITRRPHPTDRRRKLVSLEPRIEPVWEQLVACARRVRARAVQGLTPDQLRVLREGLAVVQENLGVEGLE